MADILKLKKRAAEFEAKKQMDKALATYREMIEVYESGEEDPIDIPLYNRVGDLLQKAGNLTEAVSIWEHHVEHGEVEGLRTQERERLGPGGGLADSAAVELECRDDDVEDRRLIVDGEHHRG